jgi:hypothetical protein
MALAYRIDPARQLVIITGDYAEPDEWRILLTNIVEDPAYRPGSSFIRDLRTSEHPVGAQAVMGIIAVVREFWPRLGTHRAAMVTRNVIDVPAVIAEALASDERMPLRAFTSYDEALAWVSEGRT